MGWKTTAVSGAGGLPSRRACLTLVCGMFLASAGCAASRTPRRAKPVDADALFRPAPPPDNPSFVWVQRSCVYYITSAHDAAMLPYGRLSRGQRVILRSHQRGGWADIQLLSGELASVLSDDVGTRQPGRGGLSGRSGTAPARRRAGMFRGGSAPAVPEAPLPESGSEAASEEVGASASLLIPDDSGIPEGEEDGAQRAEE